jgi:hypothetical protein
MIRAAISLVTAVAVSLAAAAVVRPAQAQPASPVRLLDVPYLPQSVALCGGAAAAMVMRYWGATGVYAETFAALVVPEEGGIRGADLLGALRERGWDARSFRGDPALVRRQLTQGRPVVALIEDRPGAFHYVVVVGWPGSRVIAHDPARAPFRVLDEAAFIAAWARSDFWTMLALPPAGDEAVPPSAQPAPEPSAQGTTANRNPCEAMVDEGVRLAVGGDLNAGRHIFEAAGAACPSSSAPWRELAGLHVLDEAWGDAAADARRAVQRDRHDEHAWRILATSLFLEGDAVGALRAWNAVGEPVIDIVNLRGLNRTRYAAALGVTGLAPQSVLTANALARARRRLVELPSAQFSRVTFRPMDDGRAVVDAAIVERPTMPTTVPALGTVGLGMLADRELALDVASPAGGGEVWRGAWRWQANRSALSLGFRAPVPAGGIAHVQGFVEEETVVTTGGAVADRRAGGSVSLADWTLHGLRWEMGGGFERWNDEARALVMSVSLLQRADRDRVELELRSSGRAGAVRTYTVAADARWRSSADHEGHVLLARAGLAWAGRTAPPALWPGAGTGRAREPLLRAHPLLDGGVIARGAFGRSLAHGGGEWRRWHAAGPRMIRFGPALFVDAARATRTTAPFDDRLHVDAGAGLRLALPGAGVVRLDVARGLRDGAVAWSVGWSR